MPTVSAITEKSWKRSRFSALEMERRADEVERETEKLKKAQYMQARIRGDF